MRKGRINSLACDLLDQGHMFVLVVVSKLLRCCPGLPVRKDEHSVSHVDMFERYVKTVFTGIIVTVSLLRDPIQLS